jgi:cytochrome P450/NADPH-cytochrome P450 reductase
MTQLEIPQPPARMIIGNVPDLRRKDSLIESLVDLAREYGGIFQLQVPLGRAIVVSDPDLVTELCDDARFDKILSPSLLLVRKRIGDGLFTAYSDEKNWHLAHRILMPTFSHANMKAYVPDMVEMAFQLMESLEGDSCAGASVDVPAEMTKLTLDTIALCGFSYRFDSFRRQDQHPFIEAMLEVLREQQNQAARPAALNTIMVGARRRLEASAKIMDDTVMEIIRARRASGPLQGREDLLEHMLTGVDKVTGERLPDDNIRAQCVTFLVAGHETTSGLLSFAAYYLMKNPHLAARAQAEADRVLGGDPSRAPSYQQIHSLDFIGQVLEEALRLWPTAPAFSRGARSPEGETIGGGYFIPPGQSCQILLPALHRSARVWGPDAESFNPDRFAAAAKESRGNVPYFPFGTGARACIGRQFAMQEAKLVLGLLMQRFDLVDSEGYQLRIKQNLTIKPGGFRLKLRRRQPSLALGASAAPAPSAPQQVTLPGGRPRNGTPLQVLYGSNLGTCEAYANDLAQEADRRGFDVSTAPLDAAVGQLGQGPLAVICSSYNGVPPENAALFTGWLSQGADLQGVRFAVFGCGNREWANTYQKVPRALDQSLHENGGSRLVALSEGDASGDLDSAFRAWKEQFWRALHEQLGLAAQVEAPSQEPLYSVEVLEVLHPNPFAEVYQATPMVVVENRELQRSDLSGRSTRHIELALPPGASYRAGDHLGVIPQNAAGLVARVAAAFGLTAETRIRLHKRHQATGALPTERIVSVGTLLTHYVELQDVATRHQLGILAGYAGGAADRKRLQALASDADRYGAEVKAPRKALVDLLEDFPSVRLPFGHYLELVAPLRPRYYSISSAPEASGRILSVTVGVVDAPARSGRGHYRGTCSSYLASIPRGQAVYAFLQSVHGAFGLPANPAVPIIMVGAGTGLAPFRGFLQERAARQHAGQAVGPATLFFGCRHCDHDFLYREELEDYQQRGVVDMVTAFSRHGEPRVYVQDRLAERGQAIWATLQGDGILYVCGEASGMASGVRAALAGVAQEQGAMTAEQAQEYLDQLVRENRYQLDVWASS